MINVLVVEDEPPIQRMICKTISEMDREFSVRYTAFNGIQAQRILEAEEVDVVFTDIESGETYVIGYITSRVGDTIKLERGKWYRVEGIGELTVSPVNVRIE